MKMHALRVSRFAIGYSNVIFRKVANQIASCIARIITPSPLNGGNARNFSDISPELRRSLSKIFVQQVNRQKKFPYGKVLTHTAGKPATEIFLGLALLSDPFANCAHTIMQISITVALD